MVNEIVVMNALMKTWKFETYRMFWIHPQKAKNAIENLKMMWFLHLREDGIAGFSEENTLWEKLIDDTVSRLTEIILEKDRTLSKIRALSEVE